MNKIKWGIIGPGKIAKKFATSLQVVPDAELIAVASRSEDRAKLFAKEFGVKHAFSNYEEMLQNSDLDVVYIATPHSLHYEHTLLCLNHSKAVLCEKPFAINESQAREMIKLAKKKQVFLMEAMWTQFLPHYQYIKNVIASGDFGDILEIKADFGFSASFNPEGRLHNKDLGGGSLLDIGIYPVFLALDLIGKPLHIDATATIGKSEVDEDCNVVFSYPLGRRAFLHSSIIAKTPTTAEIIFENASLLVRSRWHEPTSVEVRSGSDTFVKEFEVASLGYEYEIEHVQQMLRENRTESSIMGFRKTLDLIQLLDLIRKIIRLEYQQD